MFFGFIVFLIPSNLLEEYLNIESTYLFKIILGSSVFIFFSIVELRKRNKIIENLETERTKLKKENKKLNKFYKDYISSKTNYNQQSDSKILREIKKLLYESGAIYPMKYQEFAATYNKTEVVDPLINYHRKNLNDPEFKFIDSELQLLKNKLDNSIAELLLTLGKYSQPLETNPDFSSIPKDWEWKHPELFEKAVDTSNSYADEISKTYEKLISVAREKQLNL